MICSDSRIPFFRFLTPRWKGFAWIISLIFSPMVVSMLVRKDDVLNVKQQLQKANLPSSYHIILVIAQQSSPFYSNFPVNKLRNIAIRHIVTSHFFVMDMDLWPTRIINYTTFI